MKLRSYPVCPHCGSCAIVERGVVGEWNRDADRWDYGAGDDGVYSCGDCDEDSPAPRWIAVPVELAEIERLSRRTTALRLSADSAGARADGVREAARTLSVLRDKAVAHNHQAVRDAIWLGAKGHAARAA